MRKVIEGRVYNTETAERICGMCHLLPNDFHWYEEDLYKTKNGVYFIVGSGGSASKYKVLESQNCWSGSYGNFRILTEQEAKQFVEAHGDYDDYVYSFGDPEPEEDDGVKTIAEARKVAGLSQQSLSDRTGIPRRTIQNWESGTNTPAGWELRLVLKEIKSMPEYRRNSR